MCRAVLRPPYVLLAGLVATAVTVTAALGWFGWRLVRQQRVIDDRQRVQQLESSADALAAGIRGRLAEAGERLSARLSSAERLPPAIDGAVIAATGSAPLIVPAHALPYFPLPLEPAPDVRAFDAIEADEFTGRDSAAVATRYHALARSVDHRIRAGALLRLGRVLRRAGDYSGAREAYAQLATLDVETDGLPAELAGLDGLRAVLHAKGDPQEQRLASQIVSGLDAGRWQLSRGVADFYRDEVSTTKRPESWLLADAISDAWRDDGGQGPRGQRAFSRDGRGVVVLWRSDAHRTVALAAFTDRFFEWPSSGAMGWSLADADGQLLAGASAVPSPSIVRLVGNASEYPWTLRVWDTGGTLTAGRTERLLIGMVGAVLLFLWAATYVIARAIRREAEVARLQSDFVAAVSHEFRSPLTTVRQMADMLEMNRVPTEERRHAYYQVLSAEAARLQRLVETLLNFGRMEAGVERYRFVDVDTARLLRGVIADLEAHARDARTSVDLQLPDGGLHVMADEHALSIAVRNLLDNAIKYSPPASAVSVRCDRRDGRTAIAVIDHGPGIPRGEQQAIFRKFVRGRAAVDSSVKGTGVGLSMVQHIVSAHGGEVTLDSEPGRGSTFTILLPVL